MMRYLSLTLRGVPVALRKLPYTVLTILLGYTIVAFTIVYGIQFHFWAFDHADRLVACALIVVLGGLAVYVVDRVIDGRAQLLELQRLLSKSDAKFERLLTHTTDVILLLDDQNRVVHLNPMATRLLKIQPSTAVQRSFSELFRMEQYVTDMATSQEQIVKLTTQDERVYYFNLWYCDLTLDEQPLTLMNLRDITALHSKQERLALQQHQLEARVAERTAELDQLNDKLIWEVKARITAEERLLSNAKALVESNKGLSSFAYTASHDLKEPLRTVIGFLEVLERQMATGKLQPEQATTYIDFAKGAAVKMRSLLDDLLRYSRSMTDASDFEACDVNALMLELEMVLHASIAESGATITYHNLPTVQAMKGFLHQVFQNLIGNAIKFRREEPLQIQIGATDTDTHWQFCVADNGMGVPQDRYADIFETFHKYHPTNTYKGHGIGLSICKRIVERHHGDIWLESIEGQGTTFYFTLAKSPMSVERQTA